LAQPFGVGDALKSWFGLFNLFLLANQIVVAENLHASAFSDIATSRELLRRQLQLIASLRSSILSCDRELNNLPLAAGLAGARRVDTLGVIQFSKSLIKQERRRAYRRKRSAHLKSPKFKCNPPAVEPRYITTLSSGFTGCESASSASDFIDTFLVTSFREGGAPDFNDCIDSVASIDSVAATDPNSDCNAASDIASISTPEKLGVTNSVLSITA